MVKADALNRSFSFGIALLLLVVFCFGISRILPGEKLRMPAQSSQSLKTDFNSRQVAIEKAYRLLGYDLPLFYCSVSSFAVPDSFVRNPSPVKRSVLVVFSYRSAQPELTYDVWKKSFERYGIKQPFEMGADGSSEKIILRKDLPALQADKEIQAEVERMNHPPLSALLLKYIPRISFTCNNQFHYWLFGYPTPGISNGLLNGDFGKSLASGMNVATLIGYSFLLSFIMAFLVLLISIPVGIYVGALLAVKRESIWVKPVLTGFIFFYNIPSFLFAIYVVFFFANPDLLNWFPSSGPVLNTENGVLAWLGSFVDQWSYMVLPVIVLSSSSCVYVSQLVYEILTDELRKPYALTLKATGYKESYLLKNQLLKNAVLPVWITMINIFPTLISSSLLIDYFFSLNGLGSVLVKANDQHDLPVLAASFVITGVVSIFALYLSDYLIRKFDPRVNLARSEWIGGME